MTPYSLSVNKGLNKEDSRLPAGEVFATLVIFFPPDHFCIAQDLAKMEALPLREQTCSLSKAGPRN